jgi:hypothetical protein
MRHGDCLVVPRFQRSTFCDRRSTFVRTVNYTDLCPKRDTCTNVRSIQKKTAESSNEVRRLPMTRQTQRRPTFILENS